MVSIESATSLNISLQKFNKEDYLTINWHDFSLIIAFRMYVVFGINLERLF